MHHLRITPSHDIKKKIKGIEHAIDANAVAKIQKALPSGVYFLYFLNASSTDCYRTFVYGAAESPTAPRCPWPS